MCYLLWDCHSLLPHGAPRKNLSTFRQRSYRTWTDTDGKMMCMAGHSMFSRRQWVVFIADTAQYRNSVIQDILPWMHKFSTHLCEVMKVFLWFSFSFISKKKSMCMWVNEWWVFVSVAFFPIPNMDCHRCFPSIRDWCERSLRVTQLCRWHQTIE